jgi:hypothetical protein
MLEKLALAPSGRAEYMHVGGPQALGKVDGLPALVATEREERARASGQAL